MSAQFWNRLQTIDRRIIYAILIVFILIPLFDQKFKLPIIPSKQSQDFYDTIQQVPAGSLVMVDGQWSPSTRGENQWQTVAILTHLMKRHLPFAIISFDPQNNTVTQEIIDGLAPKYGYVEGRDYANLGYRPYSVLQQTIPALASDLPGTLKKDRRGIPLENIPVMKGIHTIHDLGAFVEITPAATAEFWLGLGGLNQGTHKVPFVLATTAVGAPTYYPYLDSGQISGMLTGVKGAGDYEFLSGASSFGTRATGALSLVYSLIILLIALGNIGYFAGRAAERRERA